MSKPTAADYLSGLDEKPTAEKPAAKRPEAARAARPERQERPGGGKVRVTMYLSEALHQQARTATLAIGATGAEPASLSALFDDALRRELDRLGRLHNGGKPWSPHRGRLPGGRPPKRRTS